MAGKSRIKSQKSKIKNGAWGVLALLLLVVVGGLQAQVPTNASLNGKYWFRYVQITTDSSGNLSQAMSLLGSATFNGAGTFNYSASQTAGPSIVAQVTGSGTYSVTSNGFVTLTQPQGTLAMNGRLGATMLLASTTEGQTNTCDLLVAIPAPASPLSNGILNATYQIGTVEFPAASTANARSTQFNVAANGAGSLGSPTVAGHANNLGGSAAFSSITNATYTVNPDGSGTMVFPLASGAAAANQLISGTKNIYVSADGNYIIGGSTAAGGHDILFGISALTSTTIDNTYLSGLFFTGGLAWVSGTGGGFDSYAGSANSGGAGTVLFHQRYHAPGAGNTFDFTGSQIYSLLPDGTGGYGLDRIAVGAGGMNPGLAWMAAGTGIASATNYELNIAGVAPGFSGGATFISPAGVVNAASLAPVGSPVSPGEYVSLFGVGLAPAQAQAVSFPIPANLGGVKVSVTGSNGTSYPAPLNFVSTGQINLLVPYELTGSTATFQVTAVGTTSNSVTVALAATAPGIFTQNSSGGGAGVFLHANFSPITGASPAARGETILIFMTGLGALSPTVADGAAGPPGPNTANVQATMSVLIDNISGTIGYQGLAPGFAGLYQINVTIPTTVAPGPVVPVAIQTSVAFLDQVTIAIQ
jgi:uncharacterized protein (TIGR03437 family)